MKSMFRFGLIGFLVVAAPFARGQFSVSDDFSALSGNWFNESTTGTGAFSVTVPGTEVLNYLDGGLAASGTSTGSRDWMSNTGSYAQNWQVQIDFTINLTQVNEQVSSWSLAVGNLTDLTDNIQGMFQFMTTVGDGTRNMIGGLYNTNGVVDFAMPPVHIWDVPSNTVTLRASFVAATHTLSLAYDANGSAGGYSFIPITSAAVDASGLNWGMNAGNSFGFRIAAANTAGANLTNAITAGQMYADNFAASASAIPEPATYATVLGVLALLATGWRRRQ